MATVKGGRHAIINALKHRSLSTQRAVYVALKEMLDEGKRIKSVLSIAKANKVRIKILR